MKMKCVAVFFISLASLCAAYSSYGEPVVRWHKEGINYPIVDKSVGEKSHAYQHEADFSHKGIGEDYYNPYLHNHWYLLSLKDQVPSQYYSSVPVHSEEAVSSYKPYYYQVPHQSNVVPHWAPYAQEYHHSTLESPFYVSGINSHRSPYSHAYIQSQKYHVPETSALVVPVPQVAPIHPYSHSYKYVPEVSPHVAPVSGISSFWNQYVTPIEQRYQHVGYPQYQFSTPSYHYGQDPYSSQYLHPFSPSHYGSQYGKVLEGVAASYVHPIVQY